MAEPALSPEHQALAAELALGLLEGAERAEALRLTLSDPGFATEVEAWRHRLSPLFDTVGAIPPSLRVWKTIEARIGEGADSGTLGNLRALKLWRRGALVCATIAAVLAVVLVTRPPAPRAVVTPPEGTVAFSQLSGADGGIVMPVAYDTRDGLLRLGATQLKGVTRSPELWIIPEDGVPRSLGIVRPGGDKVTVDQSLRHFMTDGATLAITLEDAASAPHKAPSGKPVLVGRFSII